MYKQLKIGLDIHGVIDRFPDMFAAISKMFMDGGHEVYVITGAAITDSLVKQLNQYGVKYTKLVSIHDYRRNQGVDISYDENGRPWMDDKTWDSTKGIVCRLNGIDLMIDDTLKYKKYFNTPFVLLPAPEPA